MANSFRRPSIFEIATAYEDGRNGEIKQKPKTKVVVNSTRRWYGKKSTVSTFVATVYNEQAKDYIIKNSLSKKNELFNFFKQYGENGIKINIGFE